MSKGWICLHRALIDWEWYSDINATRLFIHCLLKANHKQNKWRGIDIPRGSFITGRKILSTEIGLSEQQTRTALNKLISTGEITTKSTNKNTLLTVVKYKDYQDSESKSTSKEQPKSTNDQPTANQQITNEQPFDNQQVTTNNNDNNKNNDNHLNNDNHEEQKQTAQAPKFDHKKYFNLFWETYPRSEGKKTAEAKFKIVCKNEIVFADVMRGLDDQISRKWDDPKFIPHATTWLNGERWKDVISTPQDSRAAMKAELHRRLGAHEH